MKKYNSIREAAKAIDCTAQAISAAFQKAGAKGVNYIYIKKKRYRMTKIS